jgi:hypothetical protein
MAATRNEISADAKRLRIDDTGRAAAMRGRLQAAPARRLARMIGKAAPKLHSK